MNHTQGFSISGIKWKLAQTLELRWWKSYLKGRSKQEYLAWKSAYWSDFLVSIGVPFPQGKRLMDAGCGPAGIFMVLHQDNQVTALDPLLESYEAQVSVFSKADYPKVNFLAQSLESLDATNQFDEIYCLNAINHVANFELSLRNLHTALKPGGRLILSSDLHRWKLLKPIFRAIPGDALHPQQHDLEDYENICTEVGFARLGKVLVKRELIFDYWALVLEKI